jgi:hypothetical protein
MSDLTKPMATMMMRPRTYAQLGDKNAAFAAPEGAFPGRTSLFLVKVAPELDSLRSDPRYADLLRRIELPK